MNPIRQILWATILSCATTALAYSTELNLEALELEHSCGNCHDVASSSSLTGDDWLNRMRAMGPIESLSPKQRAEVAGFLRHHGWEVNKILAMTNERILFEQKCGLCHSVQRAFIKAMSEEQFQDTVMRMRRRAPQWISEDEARTIIDFVAAGARGVSRPQHGDITGDSAEVFRNRCAGCHPLERSYLYLETTLDPAWALLVKRMQLKAPDWISDKEADQIVDYLSELRPQLR